MSWSRCWWGRWCTSRALVSINCPGLTEELKKTKYAYNASPSSSCTSWCRWTRSSSTSRSRSTLCPAQHDGKSNLDSSKQALTRPSFLRCLCRKMIQRVNQIVIRIYTIFMLFLQKIWTKFSTIFENISVVKIIVFFNLFFDRLCCLLPNISTHNS